jgi:hypothetical protein
LWGSAPLDYVLIIAQVLEFVKRFVGFFFEKFYTHSVQAPTSLTSVASSLLLTLLLYHMPWGLSRGFEKNLQLFFGVCFQLLPLAGRFAY